METVFHRSSGYIIACNCWFYLCFYYPTPYLKQVVTEAPVGIVDLDKTAMSRQLIQMSRAAQQIDVKYVFDDIHQAKLSMADGNIYGYMIIPNNMERDIRTGQKVTLNVFTHGAYVMLHGNIGTAFATSGLTLGAETK